MEGNLLFDILPCGIGIHSNSTFEKQTGVIESKISPCLSITILYQGSIRFKVADKAYQFTAQANEPILFVNIVSHLTNFHRFTTSDQYIRKVNVCFDKDWLYQRCRTDNDIAQLDEIFNTGNRVLELQDTESLFRLAIPLIHYNETVNLFEQIAAEQLALTLLCHVKNMLEEQCKNTNRLAIVLDQQTLMDKVLTLALERDLTLKQIGDQLKISESTLQRKAKQVFGCTLNTQIKKIRLAQAKQQLEKTTLSISEIAYKSGYHHASNFITAYRKMFEVTPAEQREKTKQQ